MLKSFKFRLSPNKAQSELINKHIGCARFVFNLALECKQMAYAGSKVNLSCFDLNKQLPELKKECAWLKEVNSQSLQSSIVNLDRAFTNFFKGYNDFPKFKSKNTGTQSFQVPQSVFIKDSKLLLLPKFKSGIKIIIHRKFKGEIRTVTISRTPTGKYFASVLVDNKKELPNKKPIRENTTIGIDLGIKSFIVTSDGLQIDNPKYLKNSLLHLKYLQRQVSKKVKGSNSRNKSVLKLAIQHEKVANQRKDFLQKLSSKIISENQTICIEDLAVSNMIKNHKLAQSISDCGWSMFVSMLEYKASWCGKNLLRIGRFEPSSKLCSVCGVKNNTLTLEDREWLCANCGTLHNRDVNAANNIKTFALRNHLTVERSRKNLVELPTLVGALKSETHFA
jgi:putative transposase